MAKFMELKSTNPKLEQSELAKELAISTPPPPTTVKKRNK